MAISRERQHIGYLIGACVGVTAVVLLLSPELGYFLSDRFQLTFDGQTSTALDAATASAHDIETALDGLTTLVGFPDGISVSVTGTGSLDDPWLIQFITPDSIDITQQIGALALGALVNGDGNRSPPRP